MPVTELDRPHLTRAVELAQEALAAGDQPFGSVLVGPDGTVLFEDRNREGAGDATRHPEFEIARWAATNVSQSDRAATTVYTSGEHCPMCSAAHAWVGLGRIVYAASAEQITGWRQSWGLAPSPVAPLAVTTIAPGVPVDGPDAELWPWFETCSAAVRSNRDAHGARCYRRSMSPQDLANLAHLRRARDLIDREYARPLDVPTMAARALMSPAHFSRQFRAAYGETPYSYLMTRRIERAMALLRAGETVTDACMAVGCTSLGSFSSRFTEIVGETPSAYRAREHGDMVAMPSCIAKAHTRPPRTSRIREAQDIGAA